MIRVHALVRGTVQGVGYRYTTRHEAEQRGIAGWVRNRRDGTVEAELEGTPDAVDGMLTWMRLGPPGARIDALDTHPSEVTGVRGFDVRPTE
jgi:acylphosphatase